MPKSHPASCIESGKPPQRRLSGAEAVVIIVIVTMAAVLVSVAGLTILKALQLLVSSGLIAVVLVNVASGLPLSSARALLAQAV